MVLSFLPELCIVTTLYLANTPLLVSLLPHGKCSVCCPIKEEQHIKFLLYTRSNRDEPQNLYLNDERRLTKSNFNFEHPLVVYVHGFLEWAKDKSGSSQEIKDAFLTAGDYNVILIDWNALVAAPWYARAVSNVPIAGRYIATFLHFLINNGVRTSSIHFIGFSLGAEVAGVVGEQLQEWNITLPRITGLDPALPLFGGDSPHRRLSMTDAEFVDVIHTDIGLVGNQKAMGHADFYPNKGHGLQPGCSDEEPSNYRWIRIIFGCSHQRAWQYFVESVNRPKAFAATCKRSKSVSKCRTNNGRAYMGIAAHKKLRGKFSLETRAAPPYGLAG